MRPALRTLGFSALAIAVTLVGSACGNQDAVLRTGVSLTTTEPSSTTSVGVSSTRQGSTTTSGAGRPVVTTAPATIVASAGSGVTGTVLFGPVCPVERIPPDPQCAPRPGSADIQLRRLDGSVAAQGSAGPDGRFTVAVVPGRYAVRATAGVSGPGRGCQVEPEQVTVTAKSFAAVTVTCDTGIR